MCNLTERNGYKEKERLQKIEKVTKKGNDEEYEEWGRGLKEK